MQIISAYNLLNNSRLTKMNGEGKFKVIKNIINFKSVAQDYEDLAKETTTRLKPEWLSEDKAQEWSRNGENSEKLTKDEKIAIVQYLNEANKYLEEELNKECELDTNKLTDEEFTQFMDSNDFTIGEFTILSEILWK